jgi:hypothetical protein
MRAVICGLLSIGLVIALTGASDAASKREKSRRSVGYYYSSPSDLTERQLRNQRAYERGEYYEHDSNALAFGSRAWWEQKQRESADER